MLREEINCSIEFLYDHLTDDKTKSYTLHIEFLLFVFKGSE